MNVKKVLTVVVLIFVGALIGIYSTLTYQKIKGPKQTITVVGTGEVDATTDQATISIQVTNKDDADKLKTALLKLGIPESRITQNSSYPIVNDNEVLQPEIMMYPRPRPTTGIMFTLVLDNLKEIEKVFIVINDSPNTKITNTYYSLNNQKVWETKAKEMALQDARSQAESAAKINHLKVGKLVSLTEGYSPGPLYEPMMKNDAEPGAANFGNDQSVEQTGVTYSEQTVKINAQYTVQYELYSSSLF